MESVDAADVVSAIALVDVVVGKIIVDGKPPVVPAAESVVVRESVLDKVAGSTGTYTVWWTEIVVTESTLDEAAAADVSVVTPVIPLRNSDNDCLFSEVVDLFELESGLDSDATGLVMVVVLWKTCLLIARWK